MVVNRGPVRSTGPMQKPPNSTQSVRARLESNEQNVSRIQANRKPTPLLMHELGNTGPMSQVQDGQAPVFNKASGQYEPGSTGGYASLTGTGETDPYGFLEQTGPFTVLDHTPYGDISLVEYGTGGININNLSPTEGDLNIQLNRDSNMNARGDANWRFGGDFNMIATRDLNIEAGRFTSIALPSSPGPSGTLWVNGVVVQQVP
jgi:hypothetical protein